MTTLTIELHGAEVTEAKNIDEKYFMALRDYVQTGSKITADTIAQDIDRLTKSPGGQIEEATDLENRLWSLWTVLIHIAGQIPYAHASQPRLIELFKALKSLPCETVQIWKPTELWKDFPIFGPTVRESFAEPDDGFTERQCQEWVNKNSFFARLMGAEVALEDIKLAIWALRGALEEEPLRTTHVWESRVGAAGLWIIYAGKNLFPRPRDHDVDESDEDWNRQTAPGSLFPGPAGLSMERLCFWKSRLCRFLDVVENQAIWIIISKAYEVMEGLLWTTGSGATWSF